MKKFWLIARWLLNLLMFSAIALLLCYNAYVLAARVSGRALPKPMGFSFAVITSGSMKNAIRINDIIIVHAKNEYVAQDIILFTDENGTNVCHRIVRVVDDGFVTKGDANNTEDSEPVPQERIAGKVVCVIPKLGVVQEFLLTSWGMMCAILLVTLMVAKQLFWRKKRGEPPVTESKEEENP